MKPQNGSIIQLKTQFIWLKILFDNISTEQNHGNEIKFFFKIYPEVYNLEYSKPLLFYKL